MADNQLPFFHTEPRTVVDLVDATLQIGAWEKLSHPSKLGSDHLVRRAGKLCEEAGEVMGAALKMGEGTRTRDHLRDEIGDVLISLLALCYSAGIDPETAFESRWNDDVRHRGVRVRVDL